MAGQSSSAAGTPWAPETVAPGGMPMGAYLDFLADDAAGLFSEFLDPQTLSAVCTADPTSQPPPADEATRKRIAADNTDDSDDDGKPGAREGKRSRSDSLSKDAARTKACREKARREKINERFAELATLIDPGSEPKSDKPSILADAIKHVQQLRVENHQLKQLNKFLEERVAQYDRERGQQLYQHSLMLQHSGLMQHGLHMPSVPLASMPSTSLPGPSGIHSSQPLLHPIHAASSRPQLVQGNQQTSSTQGASSYSGMPVPLHPGSSSTPPPTQLPALQLPIPQVPNAASAGADPASAIAAASVAAAMGAGGKGLFLGLGQGGGLGGMEGGLPLHPGSLPQPQYWVPPTMLDSKQDSLLRPPAA